MQKYKITDTGLKGKALCSFCDGSLLIYQAGVFYVIASDRIHVRNSFVLPMARWKRMLSRFRLIERVLHCEPRWAIPCGKDFAYICYGSSIFNVNVYASSFKVENLSVRGRPLAVSKVENIEGFDNSIVIGDYGLNPDREEVRIYQKKEGQAEWEIAYSFAAGKVRHIHALIPDRKRNCIYILTGDEDRESGVYIAHDNFQRVVCLLEGKQSYRFCQAIPCDDSIIFLTDSPSEPNAVYAFNFEKQIVRNLSPIRGSCIYGFVRGKTGFFSTTCEPDAHADNAVDYWLSRKPGAGIQDRKIEIFCVSDGVYMPLYTFEGDGLPLRLMQYATAYFAFCEDEACYFTPVCVKKYDMHIFEISGYTE